MYVTISHIKHAEILTGSEFYINYTSIFKSSLEGNTPIVILFAFELCHFLFSQKYVISIIFNWNIVDL